MKYCCKDFYELRDLGYIDFSMLRTKKIRPIIELVLIRTSEETKVCELIHCPFCGSKLP